MKWTLFHLMEAWARNREGRTAWIQFMEDILVLEFKEVRGAQEYRLAVAIESTARTSARLSDEDYLIERFKQAEEEFERGIYKQNALSR